MKECIWCLQHMPVYAKEHIIPEALGCPDGFTLDKGEVCKSCNNKLGHLDRVIVDDFDILTFQKNVNRKKSKKPFVNSRGNFTAGHKGKEKFIFINMDKTPTTDPLGKHVTKFRRENHRDIDAKLTHNGHEGIISFEVPIGQNPKFVRGIYKIAFTALAYFIGSEKVLGSKYDPIRAFVRSGKGERFLLLKPSDDKEFKNQVWPPYLKDGSENYLIVLRIGLLIFFVDLSENNVIYPELYRAFNTSEDKAWTYLPIKSGKIS